MIELFMLVAVQVAFLVFLLLTMLMTIQKIGKLNKMSMAQTHEIMDNVLQRLIPLEIGKEMNRIALELLFNEDVEEPETDGGVGP
ncbi:hypothetical protein PRIPAC_92290 [Pristionchus pacificus]|uniref:Uncharacterized protein n=1 Tax=Pristionchus pacificus TaxID=54126 RepID=A0A454XIQ4_PRIPA|nr:hypothetical protein PRIPAC_92290 [Pristionchus pacificus]|eukprot:PDM65969.1 hypothetical protein PRIPAC_44248 [Pristionchus pacificus]